MIARMYQAKRPNACQFVPLRGLRYHVQTWGQPQANTPPLVMVHGREAFEPADNAQWAAMASILARKPK